jgi:hypothetical protein
VKKESFHIFPNGQWLLKDNQASIVDRWKDAIVDLKKSGIETLQAQQLFAKMHLIEELVKVDKMTPEERAAYMEEYDRKAAAAGGELSPAALAEHSKDKKEKEAAAEAARAKTPEGIKEADLHAKKIRNAELQKPAGQENRSAVKTPKEQAEEKDAVESGAAREKRAKEGKEYRSFVNRANAKTKPPTSKQIAQLGTRLLGGVKGAQGSDKDSKESPTPRRNEEFNRAKASMFTPEQWRAMPPAEQAKASANIEAMIGKKREDAPASSGEISDEALLERITNRHNDIKSHLSEWEHQGIETSENKKAFGSKHTALMDQLQADLDTYAHRHPEAAQQIKKTILPSIRVEHANMLERKQNASSGNRKKLNEDAQATFGNAIADNDPESFKAKNNAFASLNDQSTEANQTLANRAAGQQHSLRSARDEILNENPAIKSKWDDTTKHINPDRLHEAFQKPAGNSPQDSADIEALRRNPNLREQKVKDFKGRVTDDAGKYLAELRADAERSPESHPQIDDAELANFVPKEEDRQALHAKYAQDAASGHQATLRRVLRGSRPPVYKETPAKPFDPVNETQQDYDQRMKVWNDAEKGKKIAHEKKKEEWNRENQSDKTGLDNISVMPSNSSQSPSEWGRDREAFLNKHEQASKDWIEQSRKQKEKGAVAKAILNIPGMPLDLHEAATSQQLVKLMHEFALTKPQRDQNNKKKMDAWDEAHPEKKTSRPSTDSPVEDHWDDLKTQHAKLRAHLAQSLLEHNNMKTRYSGDGTGWTPHADLRSTQETVKELKQLQDRIKTSAEADAKRGNPAAQRIVDKLNGGNKSELHTTTAPVRFSDVPQKKVAVSTTATAPTVTSTPAAVPADPVEAARVAPAPVNRQIKGS